MTDAVVTIQRRLRFRAIVRGILWLVVLFALLAILLGGALALRLAAGPLEVDFVKNRVIETLKRQIPGIEIKIAASSVEWIEAEGPRFTLRDVSFSLTNGGAVGKIQHIHMLPVNLLKLDVNPRSVAIKDAKFDIVPGYLKPAADKSDRVASDIPQDSQDAIESLEALAALLRHAGHQIKTRGLQRAVFDKVFVRIADPLEGYVRYYRDISGEFSSDENAKLTLNFDAAGLDSRMLGVLTHEIEEESSNATITLDLGNASPVDLIGRAEAIQEGSLLRLPLAPRITAMFNKESKLEKMDALLRVGAGYVKAGPDYTLLNGARFLLNWRPQQRDFEIAPSFVQFGQTMLNTAGIIKPPSAEHPDWNFILQSRNAIILPRDVQGPPLQLDAIGARGSLDSQLTRVTFDSIQVRSGTVSMDAAMTMERTPRGPIMSIAADFGAMPVATVKRIWPFFVAPKARRWFIKNVHSGRVRGGNVLAGLGPKSFDNIEHNADWKDDDVKLELQFDNARLRTFGSLPDIENANGNAKIQNGAFIVKVDQGQATASNGKSVEISQGWFEISNVREKASISTVDLSLSGPADAIGSIADADPIKALNKINLSDEDVKGNAKARITASFPLQRKINAELVDWRAEIDLTNFSASKPVNGRVIKNGNLSLNADKKRVLVNGKATVDGLKADLDLTIPVGELSTSATGDVTVRLTTNDLLKQGIDTREFLSGVIRLGVTTSEDKPDTHQVDLTDARLEIPGFAWVKGAGVEARARYTIRPQKNGILISDLVFKSANATILGDIRLDKKLRFTSANLSTVSLRKDDDLQVKIKKKTRDRYLLTITGSQVDARGIINRLKKGTRSAVDLDAKKTEIEFDIQANVKRAYGFNGLSARDLKFQASSREGKVYTFSLETDIGGDRQLSIDLSPQDAKNRRLQFSAVDLGQFLKMTDIYGGLDKGLGRASATVDRDGNASGSFELRRFTLKDQGTLSKLQSSGRVAVMRMEDDGIRVNKSTRASSSEFRKFETTFTYSGDEIDLKRTRLSGTAFGGEAKGNIQLKRETIDVRGTILPVYALNNAFGQIPLLGQLLGGGKRGGLIGMTFQLVGPLREPEFRINPASVIAPGVFRKIFEFQEVKK